MYPSHSNRARRRPRTTGPGAPYARLLLALLCALPALASAQDGAAWRIAQVPYGVASGPVYNDASQRVTAFRHEVRRSDAHFLRVELFDLQLGPADYVRLISRDDGAEQVVDAATPIYNGIFWSSVRAGGALDVELSLAADSPGASVTIRTLEIARPLRGSPGGSRTPAPDPEDADPSAALAPRTVCGPDDDRVLAPPDACIVRISDPTGTEVGSGFMIDDNWMLTASHIVSNLLGNPTIDAPWTVEANVPLSDANGTIQPAAAADRFGVAVPNDPNTVLFGSTFARGFDWALVFVPDNAFRSPGAGCSPVFRCDYDPASSGEALTVTGFGVDTNDPERNHALQTDSGSGVGPGDSPFHVKYAHLDTEASNSGSPVFDAQGRIVGVHGHGGCNPNNGTGDNSGVLVTNPRLLEAIRVRTGLDFCPDTDGDGLADGFEPVIGTNPALADSDADGDPDLIELFASDPLDPAARLSPVLTELPGGNVQVDFATPPGLRLEVGTVDGLAVSVPGTQAAVLPGLTTHATLLADANGTASWLDDGNAAGTHPATQDSRLYGATVRMPNAPPFNTLNPMVLSANPSGFQRVDLPASSFRIVGMPFVPEDASVHAVLGDQLDGALEELDADRVFFFDPAQQGYRRAYLFDGSGNPAFDQMFFDQSGLSPFTLGCGEALFVQNRGAAQSIFLSGHLAQRPMHAQTLVPGWTMFAPCHAVAATAANDTTLGADGAIGGTSPLDADRLLRFDPTLQGYVGQYFFDSGQNPQFDEQWFGETGAPEESFTLDAGEGYFYRHTGNAALDWNTPRPYDLPVPVP